MADLRVDTGDLYAAGAQLAEVVYGFLGNGQRCSLTHALTDEDWAAVTDRYVIPDNVQWFYGMIRDHENRNQIHGVETILDVDGEIPVNEWMARQDWSDLPADVAEAALANRLDKR